MVSLCSIGLIGQDSSKDFNLLFNSQVRFSITPLLFDNLEFQNTGQYLIKSKQCFSGEATISYYQHIYKGFGLNIGAGFGIAAFNVNYYFKSPPGSIYQTGPYKEYYEYLDYKEYCYAQDLFTFPFSIQKVIPNKKIKKLLYNLELGIKLNTKVAFPYQIYAESIYAIDDSTEVLQFDYELVNSENRNIISYFIKAGLLKMTNKFNLFQVNLIMNYSPKNIGTGWYKFYELNFDSYGTIKQNINYIGFEFSYGWTLSKRPRFE